MCKKHKRYQGILKPRTSKDSTVETVIVCDDCIDYYRSVGRLASLLKKLSFGRFTERRARLAADFWLRKVSR